MGILQRIKDQAWLDGCEREIVALVPLSTLWLEMFMKQFASIMLKARDMGSDHQEAVLTTCKYLLTNCEQTLASSEHPYIHHYLDLASDIGVSVMKQWPTSQVAIDLLPHVETFFRVALGGELMAEVSDPVREAIALRGKVAA